MPQISPMNWSILMVLFFWVIMSMMTFISLEGKKMYKTKTIKNFFQKWNW